jgi:manganese/zinc/iron transport system permease protein
MLNDWTFQIVALGCSLLGLSAGILGAFTFLNKESLLGDALAHASLPGICLAFLITQTKQNEVLLLGALILSIICIFIIEVIKKYTTIKFDSTLALILSSFFGFGLVLLSYINKMSGANKAGLDKFIFGQASTLLKGDIMMLVTISIAIIVCVFVFWKEFKITSFDKNYAHILGISPKIFQYFLSFLTVACIIIGIQTVGVILISSLLIAPAVAARQLTNNLSTMVVLSGLIGLISCLIGVVFSSNVDNLPTGPVIAIIASIFAFASLLFAPKRGVLRQ